MRAWFSVTTNIEVESDVIVHPTIDWLINKIFESDRRGSYSMATYTISTYHPNPVGVMVSVFVSSAVDHGFEHPVGSNQRQTHCSYCFSYMHAYDGLAWNQDNVY